MNIFKKKTIYDPLFLSMLVSSQTTLHTFSQTLIFSTTSKEQPLFKSVTSLNPVFQPILTVTFDPI